MSIVPFSPQEYAALNTLRALVKALNRIVTNPDSFRSPMLRRLVESATNVLRESIVEIESYDPAAIARERKARESEPNVADSVDADVRTWRSFIVPAELPPAIELQTPKPGQRARKKRAVRPDCLLFAHHTCPHCGKQGRGPIMKRHHFDNCKQRPAEEQA